MGSKEYFDNIASDWDNVRTDFFSEAVREKAYCVAQIKAGMTAADIGAGTGFITSGLIAKDLNVIAVDQSNKMLEQLQLNLSYHSKLTCYQGESENIPICDNSVDLVFANMYLHHVENPSVSINEMVRVLKHGGKIIITDLDQHKHDFLVTEQHDRWMGFAREDIRNWFMESGLQQIEVSDIGQNCCADSAAGCCSAEISIFIASGVKP